MEKIKLTRIAVTDKKKDGTVLENQYGKFYRVGLQSEEYGDVWINGFSSKPVDWQEGDVIEVEIFKEEYNGEEQLKFKLPSKEKKLEQEVEDLKKQLAEKEGDKAEEDEPF